VTCFADIQYTELARIQDEPVLKTGCKKVMRHYKNEILAA
jgi:hypothetical protein